MLANIQDYASQVSLGDISLAETPSKLKEDVIISVDKVLADVQPEAVLILGDTNSCMAVLPAKRRKIPTFHMEAGNRCFDQRVPEEINRRLVDHMADINLTYSNYASSNLIKEGIPKDRIIKLGSPLLEVYETFDKDIKKSLIMKKLRIEKKKFFLASVHREENIDVKSKYFKKKSFFLYKKKIKIFLKKKK